LADPELFNLAYVVVGGLIGSSLLTLFPYFNEKKLLEEKQAAIRAKPPETRTPEEQYIIDAKPQGFFEEYKYRFFFGLLAGVGLTLAFLQTGLTNVSGMTPGAAIFSGITASGFLSALADKIRSSGSTITTAVAKVK
jgi:hypothetical protein